MSFAWTSTVISSVLAACVSSGLAAYAWQHRRTAVGAPFLTVVIGIAVWMVCDALVVLGADLETKILFFRAAHIGIAVLGPGYLVLSLCSSDLGHRVRSDGVVLLSLVPAAAVLLLCTNELHGWMYANPRMLADGPPPGLAVDGRFGYVVFFYYEVALVVAGSVLLAHRFASDWSIYRGDALISAAALAAPALGLVLDVNEMQLIPGMRGVPIGFGVMACLLVVATQRRGFLDVVRVGRNRVLDGMRDGVVVFDERDRLVDINAAAVEILSLAGVKPAAQPLADVLARHPRLLQTLEARADGRSELRLDATDAARSGHIFDVEVVALGGEGAAAATRVAVIHDISERVATQEGLQRESAYVRLLQEVSVATSEATSFEEIYEQSLRLICRETGWPIGTVATIEGSPPRIVSAGIGVATAPERWGAQLGAIEQVVTALGEKVIAEVLEADRPVWIGEASGLPIATHDVSPPLEPCVAIPVRSGESMVALLVFFADERSGPEDRLREVLANVASLVARAIERRQIEDEVRRLAFSDTLTGLPNRQAFHDDLHKALELAEREGDRIALLFVDLDGFKEINDTLGHRAGDAILRCVADRFSCAVRRRSGPGLPRRTDTISRLGGDEFTVLLNGIRNPGDAALVATRLIETLVEPISVLGNEVFANTSVGIAVYPEDGVDPDTLLSNADAAMYHAKSRGRNQHQFYSERLSRTSSQRLRIESRLRGALARGDFALHYQPQRDARTGHMVGAEALLRWNDSELGQIGPDVFIPIAEEMGLIVDIGEWVIETACRQAQRWREEGLRPIRIAVNVSSRQLRDRGLSHALDRIVRETGIGAGQLELELTESAIMQDDEQTTDTLCDIEAMGIGIALDDFGTGYSSLTHLRQFSIDRVKIDRSFVADLLTDPDDAALTRAIIAMAHSLRVGVVAEGVETVEQAALLAESGCDELQGYLFSEPVAAEAFVRFLAPEKESSSSA